MLYTNSRRNLVKKAIADMKGKELPDKLNLIAKLSTPS